MKSQFYLIFTAIFIISFLAIFCIVYKQDYTKDYLEEKEIAENFYRENLILFSNFGEEYAIDFSKKFFKIYSLRKNFKFLNIYIRALSTLNITILNFLKNSTIKICSDKECYQNFIEFGKTYDFSLSYSSNYLEIYFENFYKKINVSEVTFLSIYKTQEIFYSFSVSNITKKTFKPIACLIGFQYRKSILINNTQNSNNLTDYQVLVTLDTQSLISQGKMRSDCNDIRFTDSDGVTLLNYWIESGCNTNNTKIWVKVNISASSTKTIYLYYGNPNANSLSNFDNTFVLANFKNSDISFGTDTTPETCPPSVTIDYWTNYCRSDWPYGEGPEKRDDTNSIPGYDGYVYIAAASWNSRGMYQTVDISGYIPFRFSFHGRSNPTASGSCALCGIWRYCGRSSVELVYFDSNNNELGRTVFWWYFYGLTSDEITTYCKLFNHQLTGGDVWTFYDFIGDDKLIPSSVDKTKIAKIQIFTVIYTGGSTATQRFDNFKVYLRKYTSPEPTISLGNEEVC